MSFNPVVLTKKVQSIFPGEVQTILAEDSIVKAKTVILCTGAREAFVEKEESLLGRGVSYCATCDGMFSKGKRIVAYINNYKDIHEVAFLQSLAKELVVIGDSDILKAVQRTLINHIGNVSYKCGKINAIIGEESVTGIILDGQEISTDAVFFFRENPPPLLLVEGLQVVNAGIKVDANMMTNYPGIFVAGDVLGEELQVAKAVGDGLKATIHAVSYIEQMKDNGF